MLRKFYYLDEPTLDSYLSALEGGLREKTSRTSGTSGQASGGANIRVVTANIDKGSHQSEITEMSDTAAARFERLLSVCEADPDSADWMDIPTLADLEDAKHGALVSFGCELYVPDAVKMLSPQGEAAQAIDLFSNVLPMAAELGLDTEDMPEASQLEAMGAFMSRLSADLVIVGEDDSNWKIAAKLKSDFVYDNDFDGSFQIVAKLASRWPENRWKPLLALPGAGLLSRKERRALEAKAPTTDDEDNFLEGPAVMLDVLAVYR